MATTLKSILAMRDQKDSQILAMRSKMAINENNINLLKIKQSNVNTQIERLQNRVKEQDAQLQTLLTERDELSQQIENWDGK
ncbi:MAG: hypothetical protein IKP62_00635 [Salinivirgaceae bacterium]|nr:hypothetical protein [Salinivirgaceae bacterium]